MYGLTHAYQPQGVDVLTRSSSGQDDLSHTSTSYRLFNQYSWRYDSYFAKASSPGPRKAQACLLVGEQRVHLREHEPTVQKESRRGWLAPRGEKPARDGPLNLHLTLQVATTATFPFAVDT